MLQFLKPVTLRSGIELTSAFWEIQSFVCKSKQKLCRVGLSVYKDQTSYNEGKAPIPSVEIPWPTLFLFDDISTVIINSTTYENIYTNQIEVGLASGNLFSVRLKIFLGNLLGAGDITWL